MKVKLEATGVDRVIASLKARSLKGKVTVTGKVIYDAGHAVVVHEDLEMYHDDGQAKYLEQPAREMQKEMAQIIHTSLVNKNGLEEGVERALNALLTASQELVPVDTGELRDSGHVVIE